MVFIILTYGSSSASVATLIRLKCLADLTDADDILCKYQKRRVKLSSYPVSHPDHTHSLFSKTN